jgi:hypothetical protein
MLVRRIATVTISAPEASTAAARLREVAVLAGTDEEPRAVALAGDDQCVFHAQPPPTATTISSRSPSARTDPRMKALRHDLAVALDRDFLPGHRQLLQHCPDVQRGLEAVRGPVNRDLNHGEDDK